MLKKRFPLLVHVIILMALRFRIVCFNVAYNFIPVHAICEDPFDAEIFKS